jgi:hypothetical protein
LLYRILTFLLLFPCSIVVGQVFNVAHFIDENTPRFNADWVREHRIKTINGTVSYKRDDQPIRKTVEMYSYTFDEQGRTISEMHVFSILNRMDTLLKFYRYDAMDRLVKRIENDAYGYFALHYFYNQQQHLVRLYHSRERRTSRLINAFESQETIWEDSIGTIVATGEHRQTFYNNIGKPYKNVVLRYNEQHQLLKRQESNLIGGHVSELEMNWSDNGLLIKTHRFSSLDPDGAVFRNFAYSDGGCLEHINTLKNNQLLTNHRITYTNSGLVEFELNRNVRNRNMEIVEYDYTFYAN